MRRRPARPKGAPSGGNGLLAFIIFYILFSLSPFQFILYKSRVESWTYDAWLQWFCGLWLLDFVSQLVQSRDG